MIGLNARVPAMNRREMLRLFSALSAGGIATPALAQLDYLIRQPVSIVMPRVKPIYAIATYTSANDFGLEIFGLDENQDYEICTGIQAGAAVAYVDSVAIPVKQTRQS